MTAGGTVAVAVGDYDHTRDLIIGTVAVDGVEVVAVPRPEDIFARALEGEFDASEMSMAVVSNLVSRGDDRFVTLPVFPARSFRHGAIYTHADGPQRPEDLGGARIGIPVWAQTAGIVVRGFLAARHGVDLTSITWVRAGVDESGREEPVDFDHGPYRILSEPGRTLDELLLSREVDAVISARPPACIERRDPRVRRLFADPEAEERAYYRETGIFPIMHVLVIRRDALARRPTLAAELTEAFTVAKDASLRRAAQATVPSYPLPWAAIHARDARDLLGDDFWPYGIDANRATLSGFLRDAHAQRVTDRPLEPDELLPLPPISSSP
jgi:4,5-dihydroxyphthalate decarboxylase